MVLFLTHDHGHSLDPNNKDSCKAFSSADKRAFDNLSFHMAKRFMALRIKVLGRKPLPEKPAGSGSFCQHLR